MNTRAQAPQQPSYAETLLERAVRRHLAMLDQADKSPPMDASRQNDTKMQASTGRPVTLHP